MSWPRKAASATLTLALLGAIGPAAAQVVRDPPTPYHFLRYDDVPSDQQSPYWPNDFWSPLKFIPLDIAPGSYINFGGEDRERVEYFNHPFFGLTPQGNLLYNMHRLLFESDLHVGELRQIFRDGVAQKELATLDQRHCGDGDDRLGHRRQPEYRVGGHRLAGLLVAEPCRFKKRELAVARDAEHCPRDSACLDFGAQHIHHLSHRGVDNPTASGLAFGRLGALAMPVTPREMR